MVAAPEASVGAGSSRWLFNQSLPGPTLQAQRGEEARIILQNQLSEPTIVHWHGALVPPEADGHPRDAIEPGTTYTYRFPVVQRAGTLWYHPHPHHRTAAQIHRGLAGFFLIRDEEEAALRLPAGNREILLMLQDRDGSAAAYDYSPAGADFQSGMLRLIPFGNGVALPPLKVIGARYRFRILNASHARVYLLGLDNGAPLTVIGNDGGLLPASVGVSEIYLGVGERIDLLIDFSGLPAGQRLMLKSLPFSLPTVPDSGYPQGLEMDLLELVRVAGTAGAADLPHMLSTVPSLGPAAAERRFEFTSEAGDLHRINRQSFEMNRVDCRIPLGQVERWLFVNNSVLPHPVHLHGAPFQVVSRTGGRGRVFPYEAGWKDTVLVMPLETIEVLVRFERYRGIFLLHCHNLQHEDMGMMLNLEVI